jgi:hypothetical protein
MKQILFVFLTSLAIQALQSCGSSNNSDLTNKVAVLEKELQQYKDNEKLTAQRIVRFDSLDFDIYSKQKWGDISISHDENILAHYPDGHTTSALSPHIDELKMMFVFAPDTRVVAHPVKFGSGDFTCVIGQVEGTFTQPMPIAGGKSIPPTGKKFSIPMVTVGKWKGGKMVEEYLFWDNAVFARQIGLSN